MVAVFEKNLIQHELQAWCGATVEALPDAARPEPDLDTSGKVSPHILALVNGGDREFITNALDRCRLIIQDATGRVVGVVQGMDAGFDECGQKFISINSLNLEGRNILFDAYSKEHTENKLQFDDSVVTVVNTYLGRHERSVYLGQREIAYAWNEDQYGQMTYTIFGQEVTGKIYNDFIAQVKKEIAVTHRNELPSELEDGFQKYTMSCQLECAVNVEPGKLEFGRIYGRSVNGHFIGSVMVYKLSDWKNGEKTTYPDVIAYHAENASVSGVDAVGMQKGMLVITKGKYDTGYYGDTWSHYYICE